MKKNAHIIYISSFVLIIAASLFFLIYSGVDYYSTPINKRFFHPDYEMLKPSGLTGHGLGIVGTLFMITGVSTYMLRKRLRSLSRLGILKHWLEFHIFLCTLGPILVLFHTSFKFGGIVAISFWSMVAVFLSGVIGRFIYIQIPRTIEGRELSLKEVTDSKTALKGLMEEKDSISDKTYDIIIESTKKKIEVYQSNMLSRFISQYLKDRKAKRKIRKALKADQLSKSRRKKIFELVKREIVLNRRIERLDTMKNLFKYWHVAHLPFAFVMLIIMIIHVVVTLVFGYKWIF